MRWYRRLLIIILMLGLGHISINAQFDVQSLTYDQLVSGIFPSNDANLAQNWSFDGTMGDVVRINVQRVGGIFTPDVRLFAPDGNRIDPTTENPTTNSHELIFQAGLPTTGTYRIEVMQTEPNSDGLVTQNEYTLEVMYRGQVFDLETARADIPSVMPDLLPDYFTGIGDTATLENLILFNADSVEQQQAASQASRFQLTGADGRTLTIGNTNTITQIIRRIAIRETGIALESQSGALFFTDADIDLLSIDGSIVTIALSNGVTINTDFYATNIIINQGVETEVRLVDEQRLALAGQNISLTRRGGMDGEGPNAEPIILVDVDDAVIATDMSGIDTVRLTDTSIDVIYSAGWRFLSDTPSGDYFMRGNSLRPDLNPPDTDTSITDIRLGDDDDTLLSLAIEPLGLANISIQNEAVVILYENGERIADEVNSLRAIRTRTESTQLERNDDTYLTVLADGTRINTSAPRNRVAGALPIDDSFLPQNFNNLGTTVSDYHPHVNFDFALNPVNRINGNFAYTVQDDAIPSHTVGLNWGRSYNSLAPDNQTPTYQTAHNTYGTIGNGWRHSYQIELDVRQAPLGEVVLSLADGSQHLFALDETQGIFRSPSLLSWTIVHRTSFADEWIAYRSDGIHYQFDGAGRLYAIRNVLEQSVFIAPMPATYYDAVGATGGFFIIEPYGRRYEIYTDDSKRIVAMRNPQGRFLRYIYDESGYLVEADYLGADYRASYQYTDGYLTRLDDVNSPHAQQMALGYDADGRVTTFTNYPDADLAQLFTLSYSNGETRQTWRVEGMLSADSNEDANNRVMVWQHDENYRLTRWRLPDPNWQYQWRYATDTNRLTEISLPTRALLRLTYDNRGYLTRFTDPVFAQVGTYDFSYLDDANTWSRWLTQVDSPNIDSWKTFTYDNQLRLSATTQAVSATDERTVTYEYNIDHELTNIIQASPSVGNLITTITPDAFGYPQEIIVGDAEQADSRVWVLNYDAFGRLVRLQDESERITTIAWQADRNLIQQVTIDDDVYAYAYDVFDNLIAYESPRFNQTYIYDGANRLINTQDTLNRQTIYAYDSDSNLISMTVGDNDEVRTQTFAYNALNQLEQFTDFDGVRTTYDVTLNTVANRTTYTVTNTLGQQMTFLYDALGRLREVADLNRNGNLIFRYNMTYDSRGNLLEVFDTERGYTLSYDRAGQIVTSTLNNQVQTQYQYHDAGLLAQVTVPSGLETVYQYDALGNPIQATQADSLTQNYDYDPHGNLIRVTQDGGLMTDYSYSNRGLLTATRDANGHTTRYIYDEAGNLLEVIDPRQFSTMFTYDEAHRLTEIVDSTGGTTSYAYDVFDNLTSLTDASGLVTSYAYNANHQVIAISQPDDREILYGRDALGRIVSETNPLGQTTIYAYDFRGDLERIIDPRGTTQTFEWYGDGVLSRFILPSDDDEIEVEYIPDDVGRLEGIVELNIPQTTAFTYDDDGNITQIAQGRPDVLNTSGRQYRYQLDDLGRIISFAPPEVTTPYRIVYNQQGQMSRLIAPDESVTDYQYDALGQVTQIIENFDTDDAQITNYSYDESGNIIRVMTPDGITSNYAYDGNNRLISVQQIGTDGEASRTIDFEYDEAGRLIAYVDANEQRTTYNYDLFGNLVSVQQFGISDEDIITTRYSYNRVNDLIRIERPEGQQINQTFDGAGQRVRYTDATNNTWSYSYDDVGNLTQLSNPAGNTQSFEYDEGHRLQSITYETGDTVTLTYDVIGNISRVTLPNGEEARYSFDRANRLVAFGDFDALTRFTRNQFGQIETITSADGRDISIRYDANGRISTINADNETVTRTYDEFGRLSMLDDGTAVMTFTYDAFGQVQGYTSGAIVTTDDEQSIRPDLEATFAFDNAGHITTRGNTLIGVIDYQYDAFQRPIEIALDDESVSLAYNQNGWRTQLSRSNGVETRYSYDANGRIRNVVHTNTEGERLDGFAYEYDTAGNIIRVTRANNWAILYSYDVARQLTSERWLNPDNQIVYSVSYRYDEAGNRIEQSTRINQESETQSEFTYNNRNQLVTEIRDPDINDEARGFSVPMTVTLIIVVPLMIVLRKRRRLLILLTFVAVPVVVVAWQFEEVTRVTFDYDANGNLIRETFTDEGYIDYTYDSFNRLIDIEAFDVEDNRIGRNQISYDLLGRVATIRTDESIYTVLYDAVGIVGLRDESGTEQSYYALNATDTVLVESGDSTHWLLDNGLGYSQAVVDEQGILQQAIEGFGRNAFGEVIFAENLIDGDDRINQLYLDDAGIILMGVRAYHTRTGRFLQRDWVRHDPRGNLYTYAYNSPLNFIDPTGMTPESASDLADIKSPMINPQDLVQMPIIVADEQATVAQRQADENARIVSLANTLQFQVNDTILHVADTGCDVYIGQVNPLPDNVMTATQRGRDNLLAPYDSQSGWMPSSQPTINPIVDPTMSLSDVNPIIQRSLQGALSSQGCASPLSLPVLPEQAMLMPYNDMLAVRQQLERTPFYDATIAEFEYLTTLLDQHPSQISITTNTLEPLVAPLPYSQLTVMRQQTQDFMRDVLLLQPLTIPLQWQQLYQGTTLNPARIVEVHP